MKNIKKLTLFTLIFLLLLTESVLSQPQDTQKCFILLNSKDLPSLLDLKHFIIENDGHISHMMPPNVIIANITVEVQNNLTNRNNVDGVYCYSPIEMPDEKIYGKNIVPITNSWNNNFKIEELNETNITGKEGLISGPTEEEIYADYVKTKFGLTSEEARVQGILPPQTYYRINDYLIGSTAVGIFLLEGPRNKWNVLQVSIVESKIPNGLDWLGSQEPNASNSWVYDIHDYVPVSKEPADYPWSNYTQWVYEAMVYLGYDGSSTGVYDYLNDMRDAYETDWATAIFVVYGNTFGDGTWFAFSNGLYVVMTYGLDGYSVLGMPQVTVHETAHVFSAGDEYCDPGYACCGCGNHGYLSIPNSNCEAGCFPGHEDGCTGCVWGGSCVFDFQCGSLEFCDILTLRCKPNCMMLDGNKWNLCTFTRQQLGWRDCNGNGILDLMEPAENIGDSGFEPLVAGSCLNSSKWSGCTKTGPQLNEYCSGNSVYEYWANGLECSGALRDCGTSGCYGTCGTGTNSCMFHAKGCSAAACYDNSYDADNQQAYCTSCSQQWNIGGEISPTTCCGDDSEKIRTCAKGSLVTENACPAGLDSTACCSSSSDCIYNGNCYSEGDVHPSFSNLKCRNGKWDYICNPLACPIEYSPPQECGYVCSGLSCLNYCETPAKCTYDSALAPTCLYGLAVCAYSPAFGYYCDCSLLAELRADCYDRDSSQTYCEATYSGCQDSATAWNIGGEVASTTCCADDCSTEFISTCQKSGVIADICSAGYDNKACCAASNKCVYKGSCYYEGSNNPDYPCVYCNAGTWVSKTTTTLCNSVYACSSGSGDNKYNAGGGYRCQGYCDGSGNCDYAGNCEDCASKITLDTDGGNYPLTGGILTDYISCSAATCTYNNHNDYCSANILTEHYPSGTSYSSTNYDCESYENVYCDTANGDIYRNEWQCSESSSALGHCNDAVDALLQDCSNTCSDEDGGLNYTTNGTVTKRNLCLSGQISCPSDIIKIDECLSGNVLREYYCSGNDYAYQDYDCKNLSADYVCLEGKCRVPNYCDNEIKTLPYTTTQSNKYYCLAKDLYAEQTAVTFPSGVQNSTLDCLGHAIDSNDTIDTYGVYLTGSLTKNNIVKNCKITDFYHAVYVYNGPSNNNLTNINAVSNYYGIYLYSTSNNRSFNNRLSNITVTNTTDRGIYIGRYSYNNTLTNIISNYNGLGISIENSYYNQITNSIISSNLFYGINLYSGSSNRIYNNLFNNTRNLVFDGVVSRNYWNTTRQNGTRIQGQGTEIGGNYWTNSTGNGYSDICVDNDKDRFCDNYYALVTDNIDYLPLKKTIPGDIDGNCWVNVLDLSIVGNAYGSTPDKPNWDGRADLNKDGVVSVFDLSLVGKNFGKEC